MITPVAPSCSTREQFALLPISTISALATCSRAEILTFNALALHADAETGHCWPGRARLAEITHLNESRISKATTGLERKGLIRKDLSAGFRVDYYLLPQTPVIVPQPVPVSEPTPDRNGTTPLTETAHRTDQRTDQEQREPSAPAAAQTPANAAHSDPAQNIDANPPQPQPAPQQRTVTPRPAPTPLVKQPPPATAPQAWLEQAALMRPDLSADQIKLSAEIFLDDARSKGNLLADWQPAFRNWIRRERAQKPTQTATTTTNAPSRYAHLDMPQQPVSAAVRAALEAGEANRIAMLVRNGIDPVTGTRIEAPSASGTLPDGEPLPPGRNESPEDYDRRFEQHRQYQLQRAGIDPATGVRITMPTTNPTPGIKPAFTPASQQQISAEKKRRIAELAANGMTLAEAKAAMEKDELPDDALKDVSGGYYPMG